MFRWRIIVALWIVAIGCVLIAELGIGRELRTTYDTHYAQGGGKHGAGAGATR